MRFRNFKDGYCKKTLGSTCNITTGKLDANAMVEGGAYRFYTCAREFYYIDNFAFDTDALLISGNGANVGYIHHYCGKFNAYQRTYVLDQFDDNIMFVYHYLEANLHPRIAAEKKAGNTPYIVLSTLSEMPMWVPTSPEQKKIAEFLSLVDERIEQQRQLVEALKRYKRGLFLRLYDDCGKKEYKISEIGKYYSSGTLSKDDVDDFGKYPCILYGELFTKYNEIIKQVGSRTNITPTYLSGNNEVLFPSSTTADALSLIFPSSLKIENIFLGGDLFVIKLYDKFDSDFISYLLNYVYKTQLARYTQGITIIHLHYTDIKDQILAIPDINSQLKVADIINKIDMLIDKHTNKLNAQIELKKGFLQQMFI